jgi:hypothetical protein
VFRGVVNNAKSAVSAMVSKYLARASVAVPFLIAVGFALAAITIMLVERLGSVTAYWMMAGGLFAVGVVAAAVVSVKEHEEEIADQKAEQADTASVVTDATAQAMVQTPLALLAALFAMPGGPSTALSLGRILGRNLPLVVLLAAIAVLFWPTESTDQTDDEDADHLRKPNGSDSPMPSDLRH